MIEELGKTPDEIVQNLVKMDCKGEVGKPDRCPLATYIRKKVVGVYMVVVAQSKIQVIMQHSTSGSLFCQHHTFHLNEAFKTFINNFDLCQYPELIRRAS